MALVQPVNSDRLIPLSLSTELVFALLQCYWQSIWVWLMVLL